MSESSDPTAQPSPVPRFLLGATLVFWGLATDRLVIGIPCALLIEATGWVPIRWNFGDAAFLRAWRLSVLLMVITLALVVADGARLQSMARVFSWLPLILLPLQFVQSYGMSRGTTLATFSQMVRRRREHADKHQLPFREVRFSFGNAYFSAALLASSLGVQAERPYFLPGVVLLVGWALLGYFGNLRAWRFSAVAFLAALLLSGLGGYFGQLGLSALHRYLLYGSTSYEGANDRIRYTGMGALGEIKQSPEIKWRIRLEQGPYPRLLRLASYHIYNDTVWKNDLNRMAPEVSYDKDFQDFANYGDIEDPFLAPAGIPDPAARITPDLPRFRLRGAVNDQSLLPLPGALASLHQLHVQEAQLNSFGAVQIKPIHPVVDCDVLWQDRFYTERPPWKVPKKQDVPDLQIPATEKPVLARIVDELHLREGTVEEKVAKLQEYFLTDFKYTRYNRVPTSNEIPAKEKDTLISKFLTQTRAGHCEYFATATALLLREAGVPTRYTSGFAVIEIDPRTKEAFLRGTHAHAWCRAWDAQNRHWLDVDLTPPDWSGKEKPLVSRFQPWLDRFQLLREDLLVWRSLPGRMTMLTVGLLTPVVIGLVVIGRILWRSRERLDATGRLARARTRTPLGDLEKPAARVLGERPIGQPLAAWLSGLAPVMDEPETLGEALRLHQRLRYDPTSADESTVSRLTTLVARLKDSLHRHKSS